MASDAAVFLDSINGFDSVREFLFDSASNFHESHCGTCPGTSITDPTMTGASRGLLRGEGGFGVALMASCHAPELTVSGQAAKPWNTPC